MPGIKIILSLLFGLLFCSQPQLGFAKNIQEPINVVANELQDIDNFNPIEANKELDQISLRLSTRDLDVKELQQAIKILTALQSQSEICVKETQSEIDDLTRQLTPIETKDGLNASLASEVKYLEKKKHELNEHLSGCRLFLLRSKEAVDAYSSAIQEVKASELLDAKSRFWDNLSDSFALLGEFSSHVNYADLQKSPDLKKYRTFFIIFGIVLLLSLVFAIKLRRLLACQVLHSNKISEFFHIACLTLRHYIIPLVLLFTLMIFTSIFSLIYTPQIYLLFCSLAGFFYVLSICAIRLVFHSAWSEKNWLKASKTFARSMEIRLFIFVTMCLIGFILYFFPYWSKLPIVAVHSLRTIFMTIFAINLIRIIWLINRSCLLQHSTQLFRTTISFIFFAGLFLIISVEWFGYHELSFFILRGITLTLISALIAWSVYQLISRIIDLLSDDEHPWQMNLRAHFGLKKGQNIPELFWLNILNFVLVLLAFILVQLKVWALSEGPFLNFVSIIEDGFTIGGLDIIPSRILMAVFVFLAFVLVTRYMRTQIHNGKRLKRIQNSHEAFVAIIGYIGFTLSLLFALIVAGVNLSSIALITGALSVGIGFGLQNIVNNFVSGIILLIERPIKHGDRIIVGDTEGIVRRISIRSTQITTSQHADVIVPNAQLISSQVTNLMFQDAHFGISVLVTVAYGSDITLVKQLLLDIAKQHEHIVIDAEPLKPGVLLRNFADNGILFELGCFVTHVNHKNQVQSDLRFAIYEQFAAHKIELPFPQQDIHIRDWQVHDKKRVNDYWLEGVVCITGVAHSGY